MYSAIGLGGKLGSCCGPAAARRGLARFSLSLSLILSLRGSLASCSRRSARSTLPAMYSAMGLYGGCTSGARACIARGSPRPSDLETRPKVPKPRGSGGQRTTLAAFGHCERVRARQVRNLRSCPLVAPSLLRNQLCPSPAHHHIAMVSELLTTPLEPTATRIFRRLGSACDRTSGLARHGRLSAALPAPWPLSAWRVFASGHCLCCHTPP